MNSLSDYYVAVACKYLSAVDAEPNSSNQHEFGGLVAAGFGQYLGQPGDRTLRFPARFLLFSDSLDEPTLETDVVSWYDVRRNNPNRGPELRLYYRRNLVTEQMSEGDLLVIGKRPEGSFDLFIAPGNSAIVSTLCYLFNVHPDPDSDHFSVATYDIEQSDLVRATIFSSLGIEVAEQQRAPDFEDLVTAQFGIEFPPTREFSIFARDTLDDIDPVSDPDHSLLEWLQREELLFLALENVVIQEKIANGFSDVNEFISFSLSVQNRRKSRAGRALESHLREVLIANHVEHECGAITENRSKPDFLFPGAAAYHNPETDPSTLMMLGAKTSCKDRWRQVLSEAARIQRKHLITIQTGISETQLLEMASNNLQLVVPAPLHETYADHVRPHLISLERFISLAKSNQEQHRL